MNKLEYGAIYDVTFIQSYCIIGGNAYKQYNNYNFVMGRIMKAVCFICVNETKGCARLFTINEHGNYYTFRIGLVPDTQFNAPIPYCYYYMPNVDNARNRIIQLLNNNAIIDMFGDINGNTYMIDDYDYKFGPDTDNIFLYLIIEYMYMNHTPEQRNHMLQLMLKIPIQWFC